MTVKYKGFESFTQKQRYDFRDKLEKFVVDVNKESGPSLQCFLSTYDKWTWL